MPLLVAALDDPSPAVICEAWRQLAQSNEWMADEYCSDRPLAQKSPQELLKLKRAQYAELSKLRAQLVLESISDSTTPQSTLFKWKIASSLSGDVDMSRAIEILDAKMDDMPEWLRATALQWTHEQT